MFLGVLGASMSTLNGAILVISVVLARNIYQRWTDVDVSDSRLLLVSRLMAIPTAAAGAAVAWRWPQPGILLVVAFDIVFAGCVVPLFCGVYWRRVSSTAAIASIRPALPRDWSRTSSRPRRGPGWTSCCRPW